MKQGRAREWRGLSRWSGLVAGALRRRRRTAWSRYEGVAKGSTPDSASGRSSSSSAGRAVDDQEGGDRDAATLSASRREEGARSNVRRSVADGYSTSRASAGRPPVTALRPVGLTYCSARRPARLLTAASKFNTDGWLDPLGLVVDDVLDRADHWTPRSMTSGTIAIVPRTASPAGVCAAPTSHTSALRINVNVTSATTGNSSGCRRSPSCRHRACARRARLEPVRGRDHQHRDEVATIRRRSPTAR